jgi:hypothetical protein
MITYEQYITANNKYPERLKHPELTDEIRENSEKLIEILNNFLTEMGIKDVIISSGWRPSDINSKTKGAAKKSLHQTAQAIDIVDDKDQSLGKLVSKNPEILRKYELFVEDIKSTKGQYTNWVHLDCGLRKDRPSRSFVP